MAICKLGKSVIVIFSLVMWASVASANPPPYFLHAVRVTTSSGTVTGYTSLPETVRLDRPEALAAVKVNSSAIWFWTDLEQISYPREMLVSTGKVSKWLTTSSISRLEFLPNKYSGWRFQGMGIIPEVEPEVAALLKKKPHYSCAPDAGKGVYWLSYNPKIGEADLAHICQQASQGQPSETEQTVIKSKGVIQFFYDKSREELIRALYDPDEKVQTKAEAQLKDLGSAGTEILLDILALGNYHNQPKLPRGRIINDLLINDMGPAVAPALFQELRSNARGQSAYALGAFAQVARHWPSGMAADPEIDDTMFKIFKESPNEWTKHDAAAYLFELGRPETKAIATEYLKTKAQERKEKETREWRDQAISLLPLVLTVLILVGIGIVGAQEAFAASSAQNISPEQTIGKWLVFLALCCSLPTLGFYFIAIGFVPAIWYPVTLLLGIFQGNWGEVGFMGVLNSIHFLIYGGLFYLVAWAISARIYRMESRPHRFAVLLTFIGFLIVASLLPIYHPIQHNAHGSWKNILTIWASDV